MAASGTAAIQGTASAVPLGRHRLQLEAQRHLGVVRRIGRRLANWLDRSKDLEVDLERIVGRDPESGRDLTELVTDADGKHVKVPLLPDADFRQNWELYERALRNLLAEQRARAALADKSPAPQISDEVYEAQIAQLARKAVMEMPRAELEALLTARRMNIVQGATESRESPNQDEPASHTEVEPLRAVDHPGRTPPDGNGDGAPSDLFDFGGEHE